MKESGSSVEAREAAFAVRPRALGGCRAAGPLAALTLAAAFAHGAGAGAACPDAGTPPTPVDVSVTSVPISVASTTADYFVLYVNHAVGDNDVREVPVSVTRGQAGTTALSMPVKGLAASRYKVERYEIADPADVDGDCKDDLTDPNPVNPAKDLAAKDGFTRLATTAEWDAIEFDVLTCGGCRSPAAGDTYVKINAYGLEGDRPNVYFVNASTHRGHPLFATALELGIDYVAIELDVATGVPDAGADVTTYYWWFSNVILARRHRRAVPLIHSTIAASLPIMTESASEWRLAYYIPDSLWSGNWRMKQIESQVPAHESAGVTVLTDRSFFPDAPEVSIAGGPTVTEGRNAAFTLTTSPAPTTSLKAWIAIADVDLSSEFLSKEHAGWREVEIKAGAATTVVTVPTVDDTADEPDGQLNARIGAGAGYLAGSPISGRVGVRDNDPAYASLLLSAARTAEGGAVQVEASLTNTWTGDRVIPLAATAGTAEPGDYTAPSSVTVAAGATSGKASLATVRDLDVDDETLTIAIDAGNLPAGVVAGSPASASFLITDLTPEASLAVSVNPLDEGGSTRVEARLTKSWTADLVIPLLTTAGTAEPGDYTAPSSVTVPAGATLGQASLSTVDDADTDDETLTVEFGALPAGVAEGSPRAVELVVRDGTPTPVPEVTLEASPSTVEEGAAATVTARLGKALAGGVTIPLIVAPGSAEPEDYDVPAAVVIAAGQRAGTSVLRTRDDADTDDETLTVALGALPPEARAGSPDRVEIAIRDADEDPPPPPPGPGGGGGGAPPPPPNPGGGG